MPSLTITNQFCSKSSHNLNLLSGHQFNCASDSLLTADKGFIHQKTSPNLLMKNTANFKKEKKKKQPTYVPNPEWV